MKRALLIGLLLMGALSPASATLYYQGTGVGSGTSMGAVANPTILDGNPVGTANTMSLSGLGPVITDITVTLNLSSTSGNPVSGLYAYLSHDGQVVVLLNCIGVTSSTPFGNTGSSLLVTLDSTDSSIHGLTGSPAGNYGVDNNQTVSPFAPAGSFTGGSTATLDSIFAGVTGANGNWTLYFADVVNNGGENTTLTGWSLNLTTVPEPVTLALGMFVGMLLTLVGLRWAWAASNKKHSCQTNPLVN